MSNTSGHFLSGTSTSNYRLRVDWEITSQNLGENKSSVTVKVSLVHKYEINWIARSDRAVTLTVGTVTPRVLLVPAVNVTGSGTVELVSRNYTITHNSSSGARDLDISAHLQLNINSDGFVLTSLSASDTVTLKPIPRQTDISAASFSASLQASATRNLNLTLNIKNTAYRHDVVLRDGTHEIKTWENVQTPTSNSLTATEVNNILGRMSSVTAKNFTVEVTTKTGVNGTKVGNSVTQSVRATIHTNVAPTISNKSDTIAGSGYDNRTSKRYVQTISSANISFSGSAGQGASLSELTATINNGGTISGSRSGSTWSGSTGVFNRSSTYTVTLTAKDSRGRTATDTISISVLAYSPPAITEFSATRADSGTGITLSRRTTFSNPSGLSNARKIDIYRKRTNVTAWGTAITTVAFHSDANGTLVTYPASGTRTLSYNFRIVVTDRYGSVATSEITVGTASVLMSFNKDIGVGIGKIHERGALDIQGDAYMNSVDISSAPLQAATLQNGWTGGTEATYGPVGYYKVGGIVYLSGLLEHPGDPVNQETIFVLPEGYRPQHSQYVFMDALRPSQVILFILRSGVVRLQRPVSGDVYFGSIHSISFPAGG